VTNCPIAQFYETPCIFFIFNFSNMSFKGKKRRKWKGRKGTDRKGKRGKDSEIGKKLKG